jgi:CheY-like chemotaxis protein
MEQLAGCPDPLVIPATSGRVLLVEDNPINRKLIALTVRKLGYAIAIACDGQEALDYLCKQSAKPRPNTVLMDCMMPVLDGYEATRRIREDDGTFDEHVRALPIIALTASAIKGDREKCKEAGMDDYLTKPAARGVLKRTLETWIGLRRPQALDRSKSAC